MPANAQSGAHGEEQGVAGEKGRGYDQARLREDNGEENHVEPRPE